MKAKKLKYSIKYGCEVQIQPFELILILSYLKTPWLITSNLRKTRHKRIQQFLCSINWAKLMKQNALFAHVNNEIKNICSWMHCTCSKYAWDFWLSFQDWFNIGNAKLNMKQAKTFYGVILNKKSDLMLKHIH